MSLELLRQLPGSDHEPAEVRDLADEILARPEYREPGPSLLERFSEWVGERIADLLSILSLGGAVPAFVAWVVLVVLLAGLAALLVWAVRSVSWRRTAKRGDEVDAVIVGTEPHRPSQSWLREAEDHEAAGRWREGILCRYRALVTELVVREVIAELVGRTAGEYLQDVRRRAEPQMASKFSTATELFEDTWYGAAPTGPAERDRFIALSEELRHLRTHSEPEHRDVETMAGVW
jgi:hypothetical protein